MVFPLHAEWLSPEETLHNLSHDMVIISAPNTHHTLDSFCSYYIFLFFGLPTTDVLLVFFMWKADRKNGTFVRLSGDNVLANWWFGLRATYASTRVPCDGWTHCVSHEPCSRCLDLGPSGVTGSHSARENFALAEGSLPSCLSKESCFSQFFIGLVTSVDTMLLFRRWHFFFPGHHLYDNRHCSCVSNKNVIEITVGSSSLMKVDLVEVTWSGGGGWAQMTCQWPLTAPSAHPLWIFLSIRS